ncbi:hypothetical protein [Saccharothrix deserti]|uniref:hypothetical protein n=1 Tax=Saccharothrix deserti TaxID=2593674 RepID=UPI00131B3DFC|nr:hypothetical protein [Saccharothrix deserti]
MSQDRSLIDRITDELRRLAERGIGQTFEERGKKCLIDIPKLCELTERHFSDEWERDQALALELLVRQGISQLGGRFGAISCQEAALRLYNLQSLSSDSHRVLPIYPEEEKRYPAIRGKLEEEARVFHGGSTLQRRIKALRRSLATILAHPDFAFNRPSSASVASAEASQPSYLSERVEFSLKQWPICDREVPYVRRAEYHDAFDAALNNGAKIVTFVGPPGSGKTRLVSEIVAEKIQAGEGFHFLESNDEHLLALNAARILAGIGIEVARMNDEQVVRAFLSTLHSQAAAPFTIFHGLHDESILYRLNVAKLETVVIVIRSVYLPEGMQATCVPVQPFGTQEALKLSEHIFPDEDEAQRKRLIFTVGSSPDILIRTKSFISRIQGHTSIDDFCRSFPRNASLILRSTSSDLISTYRYVIDRLDKSNQDAAETLQHIVFLTDLFPIDLLVAATAIKHRSHIDDRGIVEGVVLFALDVLKRHSLIDYDGGIEVKLNRLAQAVLRDLMRVHNGQEVAARLRAAIIEQFRLRLERDWSSRPQSIRQFMMTARLYLDQLFHLERTELSSASEDAAREVARVIQELGGVFPLGQLQTIEPVDESDHPLIYQLTFRLDRTRVSGNVDNLRLRSSNDLNSADPAKRTD